RGELALRAGADAAARVARASRLAEPRRYARAGSGGRDGARDRQGGAPDRRGAVRRDASKRLSGRLAASLDGPDRSSRDGGRDPRHPEPRDADGSDPRRASPDATTPDAATPGAPAVEPASVAPSGYRSPAAAAFDPDVSAARATPAQHRGAPDVRVARDRCG